MPAGVRKNELQGLPFSARQELLEKRQQWQGRLDEQLAAAQDVVDEAQGRPVAGQGRVAFLMGLRTI